MNLAETRCTEAIAVARRVLRIAGVRTPEELDIELIAARLGVCSIPKVLPGHAGNLVRLGDGSRALVAIEASTFGTPRGFFTLGHELGHHLLHPGPALAAACFESVRRAAYFRAEREADVFAVEVTLPEALFRGRVLERVGSLDDRRDGPSLELVQSLAMDFRSSLTATAFRLADVWTGPLAIALVRGGRIVRHARTASFPLRLVERFELGRWAHARSDESLAWHEPLRRAEQVPGDAWSRDRAAADTEILERSVRLGATGMVLSILCA